MGPRAGLSGAENLAPTGIRPPDCPARSSVAIPTELPDPLLGDVTKDVSVKSLLKSAVLWNVKRAKLFLYTPCGHMGSSDVVSLILNTAVSGQLHSSMALPSGKVLLHQLKRGYVVPRADLVTLSIPLGIDLRFVVLPTHFPITIPTTPSQSTNCPSQKKVFVSS